MKYVLLLMFTLTIPLLLFAQPNDPNVVLAKSLPKYKNVLQFGVGGAYGFAKSGAGALVYNASYQRDLLHRLTIEARFEDYRINNFPSFASGKTDRTPAELRDYILSNIRAGEAHLLVWDRQQSTSLGVNVLFHMVAQDKDRFSIYAGLSYVHIGGVTYSLIAASANPSSGMVDGDYVENYHAFAVNYWQWQAGLRYAHTFKDRYTLGLDLGYQCSPYLMKAVSSNQYLKANVFFGIRL